MKNQTSNGNGKKGALKNQVQELYDLMKQGELTELEIKDGDTYVHIKRQGAPGDVQMMPMHMAPAHAVPVAAPAAAAPQAKSAEPAALAGETVKSPIIGTFYRSPSPGSPVYANEGDVIEAGKTLCIVEAMKVMNEIKAEKRVKVLKMLVENGTSVTAGQDLFLVENS